MSSTSPISPAAQTLSAALAVLALLICAALVGAPGALAGKNDPPKAELATTGDESERIKAVPISKKPATRERVVMTLPPDQHKPLEAGQTLRVNGEVQVSTTCVTQEPRCIGRHYSINPTVATRIVLSSGPLATDPSFAVSATTKKLCKQRRPNRNHHCTLTIPSTETAIDDPGALPCALDSCYLNMILGASNKKAKPGNKVVLGADRPDGSVAQDKGRLNLVQANRDVGQPAVSASDALVNTTMPTTEGEKEKRRVVYSVPIFAPRKGEILSFDSSFVTGISDLRFNTFIAARVIVAETPTATESSGLARQSALFKGAATESNGFNCTLGASGYANPCTVVKAGATRITRDAVDEFGLPATLYLNVVAASKPLLAEKIEGTPLISLGHGSGLKVVRYTPSSTG